MGLIDAIDAELPWARRTGFRLNSKGETVYTSTSVFLNNYAIRCLAALTLEGFTVRIDSSATRQARVYITEPGTKEGMKP